MILDPIDYTNISTCSKEPSQLRFKPLFSIDNLRDNIQADRQEQSQKSSRKGFELLGLAFQKDYLGRRKQLISEALEAFKEAIKTSGGNSEAYIGMAYLLIVLKDYARALRYLQYGYRLSAQDPNIQDLLQLLQSGEQARLDASGKTLNPQQEDALQEIEGYTFQVILDLIQEAPLPDHLTDQDTNLQSLEARYQYWEQAQKSLVQKMALLRPDWNDLDHQPLEQLVGHYAQFIRLSRHLIDLEAEIHSEEKELKRDLWRAETLLSTLEAKTLRRDLEHFFDECDRFADDLEQIEQQGYQVSPALDIYGQFMQQVERFQDVLNASEQKLAAREQSQSIFS